MRKTIALILIAVLALPAAAAPQANDLETRRKQLNDLLADQWEYTLRTSPEFASILGDKRYNDKLSDNSEEAIQAELKAAADYLQKFEAIDVTGFPVQEQINKQLMVRDLREQLDNAKFTNWRMPVNQFNGIHLFLPQLPSLLSFTNAKDYEDYIARLNQFPRVFDEHIIQMRKGMAAGLMQPRMLLEKVVGQAEKVSAQKGAESPFAAPLKKFPENMPQEERARLRARLLGAIEASVTPSYARFILFVRDEYAPKGRTEPGVWSLPDGAARYAAAVKSRTTTNRAPEDIHQLGLREVARIEGEMLKIAKKLGFKDLKSFNKSISEEPKLHGQSREHILSIYQKHTDAMYKKLPQLFGRLPKAKVIITSVEEFREKEASGASYIQGAADGSRPGKVMVNTGDFKSRKIIDMESTAYHEAVPGHHMQIAIAQELPELPQFRRQGNYTAFAEGWALYSERLGKEVGFYQDPYFDYGRLQDEMLRAIRLVVDTGFHHKKWTRQQVVDYFHDHSGIDEPTVQSETDRYMAWPAQALAYKLGQLKILELRERAQKELGKKFDIRTFHDEVLGAGALPLDVLETRINAWIAAQK